jgi:hypothetical protein
MDGIKSFSAENPRSFPGEKHVGYHTYMKKIRAQTPWDFIRKSKGVVI